MRWLSKLEPYLLTKYEDKQQVRRLINDMANIAFLPKRNSIRKGNQLPEEYLKRVVEERGEDALTAQNITLDKQLWTLENYEEFLRDRRRKIVKSINDLLKSLDKTQAIQTKSLDDKIKERESDHKLQAPNRELIQPVLKTIAAFMNTPGGGVLLIGVHDETRDILGIESDYNTFNDRRNWDGWYQTLVNGINTKLGKELSGYWEASEHIREGKTVAEIQVRMSSRPVFYDPNGKAEFYIRSGNTTQALNPKQASDYIREHWG